MEAIRMSEKKLRWLMTILFFFGAGIIYISVQYIENKYISYIGLLLGGVLTCISGDSAQAHMLKINPFKSSYKEARESYKEEEEKNNP
jgi:hypothetical protein